MSEPTLYGDYFLGKYKRFMSIAQAFAQMSKDRSTKVGCVILGQGFEVRASGWNGAPRRSQADVDHRSMERDSKLMWTCHAEANAIANAARSGTSLDGSTIIVTHTPCMSCAKLIVQAGILQVIAPRPDPEFYERWKPEMDASKLLFKECLVQYHEIDTAEAKA